MGMIFHNLIKFREAEEKIRINSKKISETERIKIGDSCGRISAEDIFSASNLPLFSRSQVDGYAVIASDLAFASRDAPVSLELSGETSIGEPAVKFPGNGKCIKVPTGGVIPLGADAMVPFEDTETEGNRILFFNKIGRFHELSNSGIDVIKGERLLGRGSIIDPRSIAVMASTGIGTVNVIRKIRIGIVSTGNELLYPGQEYEEGKIYESNSISVYSELKRHPGFEVRNYGIIRDDYSEIKDAIDSSIEENDVTITIGSTSAGDHDMVYLILGDKKPGIIFHGIRVKPGKPAIFAKSGDKLIFGLPGFPVSSMMILYSLVIPALFSMAGHMFSYTEINAISGDRIDLHQGNTDLLLLKLVNRAGSYYAYQVPGNSGSISRISRAAGFSIVHSDSSYLPRHSSLGVKLFTPKIPEILLYGQYLPAMEHIPGGILDISTFVEAGKNEIVRSMAYGDADVYLWNYRELPDMANYYDSATFKIPYGVAYRHGNYKTMAVMYQGSGLYEYSEGISGPNDITYLDNPEIICDYVRNGRCDAGITYRQYAELYSLEFEQKGCMPFHVIINKDSRRYEDLKNAFASLAGANK
ncbi:MAG: molybdopterin molybdotransferase MoeA [Ferroplasma sp.]|uniref:molybdopterin molybdotransferase MoeA n=1 Tax=Ferroplasma sp. TaxID=2591003 RepID=UPI002814B6E8|nr:molybdopterin molybdotransferase MoeA [Ferroplasma sp.]WMT51007.1 MAG: molybdopterin molybdotransferase MoeA [Ferroplasma sp.]